MFLLVIFFTPNVLILVAIVTIGSPQDRRKETRGREFVAFGMRTVPKSDPTRPKRFVFL